MSKESFNNLIFVLFLVVVVFISGIFLALSLRLFSLESFFFKTNYMIYSNFFNQIILGVVGALLFFLAIYLICQKVKTDKGNLSVVQKTSFGEIKISIGSIQHLILKVIKGIGEITETRPEVNILKSGGINIDLHLSVKQDVNIPELSEKIQRKLKEYLLETSGIETKEIKIHIEKIFYEDKK
ncbi:MAG: alkaline shock response membrane anchor protein AmaP [Candidatus Atribacteria bacterium]|nr:MAG: alkaline shock response membrane anchor protein AmaP [Candidatus Atribacteria bacterium]